MPRNDTQNATSVLSRPEPDWALFLDLDGTLLEIAPRPDSVRVSHALPPILRSLQSAFGGAVALVSGRPIAEIDRLLAPYKLPTAGLHGLERRDAAGNLCRAAADRRAIEEIRRGLSEFSSAAGGVLIEDKELSVALHYRQAPEREGAAREAVARVVARLGSRFHVQEGKMVLEIKPRDADKGRAIEAFMAEPPFIGRRPVFVGDDITDEDGFAVVNRLGGHSIRVGNSAPTRARLRIASVAEMLDWLRRISDSQPSTSDARTPSEVRGE